MKDTDLLLDDDERTAAWNEGVESGRADWAWAGAEAVARAQAAKALAYLIALAKYSGEHCGTEYVSAAALSRIIAATGLTWPPKEG